MTGSTHRRRSRRDWIVDSIVFVLAVLFGIYTFSEGDSDPVHQSVLAIDLISGMALCLTPWFRRWWPVQLALVAAVVSIYSEASIGAALVLIMTVAIHRPWRTSLLIFGANAVSLVVYLQVRHKADGEAVGEGKSNAEISATLYLSVPTVKTHVSRILTKLDLNNRVQIALLVHDADLLRD